MRPIRDHARGTAGEYRAYPPWVIAVACGWWARETLDAALLLERQDVGDGDAQLPGVDDPTELGQGIVGHAPPPAIEELAGASQPGTRMAGIRQFRFDTEPGRGLTGKARAAHRQDPDIHLPPQVPAQQLLVQPVTGPLGTRMRVHIDQARQHPPPGLDVGANGVVVRPHRRHRPDRSARRSALGCRGRAPPSDS